jgi:predicted RNA binding protein YcfA (HicA-like mRNA interferase family)
MDFRELEKIIRADGWWLARTKGSHYMYIHAAKPGTVVIPFHKGDIDIKTAQSVLKLAGII